MIRLKVTSMKPQSRSAPVYAAWVFPVPACLKLCQKFMGSVPIAMKASWDDVKSTIQRKAASMKP